MRSDTGRDSQYVVGGSSSPNRFTAATFSIPDMSKYYPVGAIGDEQPS
jgi:hypothetical protein